MSLFHYIGSAAELPIGERGSVPSAKTYREMMASPEYQKKAAERRAALGLVPSAFDLSHLKDEQILVFDTEEDAAGIYIQPLGDWFRAIRQHFKSPFVYQLSPNWGGFTIPYRSKEGAREPSPASEKCCRELFKLMEDYGAPAAQFELYSCWADEEHFPRKKELDRIIHLADFQLEDGFELLDKQYIVVQLA
ncbi:hypothetical protein EBB07_15735 [Paenibacillaceae bacterium]|nr:hypothetical protein EBB07_15735 [Paenibacillaceae bacterium]